MEKKDYEKEFEVDITDQNEIQKLLDNLKKENKNEEYLENLLNYYPILSPEICQRYEINKKKTEKETLFNIVNNLINKFGYKNENEENLNKEIYEYINNIFNEPAEDELKNLKIKNIPSRWNYVYIKIIRLEKETNDELIFYSQTNDLLNNILNNKRAIEIIYFLKEFMTLFNKLSYKNYLPKFTKKFLLLGLCNCEFIDDSGFLEDLKYLVINNDLLTNEKYIQYKLNPEYIYNGKLQEIIIKFSKSKLASSAFIKIFKLKEIPTEIKNEIFDNNINKYICYFPYSSYDNTERTIRRLSLILINSHKNKKLIGLENNKLDKLLSVFSNIVIRKFTFGHEHQHLSGGLLFFLKKTDRLSTPPHKIEKGILTYNNKNQEKGERGEIFEILCYGKVFKVFNIFDLIFIADESNDNLNIDEHFKKFEKYCKKKKELLEELKKFPEGQTLSEIVKKIYNELLNDKKSYEKISKGQKIAYRNEGYGENEDYITLLENAENLVTREICPLSKDKTTYKRMNKYFN